MHVVLVVRQMGVSVSHHGDDVFVVGGCGGKIGGKRGSEECRKKERIAEESSKKLSDRAEQEEIEE